MSYITKLNDQSSMMSYPVFRILLGTPKTVHHTLPNIITAVDKNMFVYQPCIGRAWDKPNDQHYYLLIFNDISPRLIGLYSFTRKSYRYFSLKIKNLLRNVRKKSMMR